MVRISKNNYNGSSLSTGRNFVDNTRGMIPGLTKGETYGTGEEIKRQVELLVDYLMLKIYHNQK